MATDTREQKQIRIRLDRPFTMIPLKGDVLVFPESHSDAGRWKVVEREHQVMLWDPLNNQLMVSAVVLVLQKELFVQAFPEAER